jgi:hypothetical protein
MQQEKPNDRKKLYEANHLYMMKLALIETNLQGKHHIKISPIHSKDDLSIKKRGESSKFRR